MAAAAPPAPFHAEVADGPEGAEAAWLTAADGVRLRVAFWGREAPGGTVLLFPGRTEWIEKYGRTAAALRSRGLATLAVDWRGQGLADRLAKDRLLGHVGRFADYQLDVAAVLAHARGRGLPEPYYLLGHSMGGAIGLRALIDGLPVRAAAFTGPMWGIAMSLALRPMAWGLSSVSRPLGLGTSFAPGQDGVTYVLRAPFEGNSLTTDPDMFAYMRGQLVAHPELALGGPSLHWLYESLREIRALSKLPSPAKPCVTFLGSDETIVDTPRVLRRMADWPGGELVQLPGARHEVLMELPALRDQAIDGMAALFARHR